MRAIVRLPGGDMDYLMVRQIVEAVIGWQAAMVGGDSGNKVVQQVLTCHKQTRETDQGHMDPLVPAKTTHLNMAGGWG